METKFSLKKDRSTHSISIISMSQTEVQMAKDTIMFDAINPPLTCEISDDLIKEIIKDLEGNDLHGIFNNQYLEATTTDDDINDDELNNEIYASLNELSDIEKELLKY